MIFMLEVMFKGKLNGIRMLDFNIIIFIVIWFEDFFVEWFFCGEGDMLKFSFGVFIVFLLVFIFIGEILFIYSMYKEEREEVKILLK